MEYQVVYLFFYKTGLIIPDVFRQWIVFGLQGCKKWNDLILPSEGHNCEGQDVSGILIVSSGKTQLPSYKLFSLIKAQGCFTCI